MAALYERRPAVTDRRYRKKRVATVSALVTVGFSYDDKPTVNSSRLSLMRSA